MWSGRVFKNYKNIILHTNQHYDFDMSDIFLKELNIKNQYYLKDKTLNMIDLAELHRDNRNIKRIKRVKPNLQ